MTDIAFIPDFLEFDKLLIKIGDKYYYNIEYSKQQLIDKINQHPNYKVRNKALQDLELINESVYTDFIDVHTENNDALRWAAEKGDIDMVKFLVEKGADINANDGLALFLAANIGNYDMVKYLVEKGADIHACNDSALCCAAENGSLDVLKFLVEKGADINANGSVLAWAVYSKNLDMIEYLVEQGADISANNYQVLEWAKQNKHTKVLKYLKSVKKSR